MRLFLLALVIVAGAPAGYAAQDRPQEWRIAVLMSGRRAARSSKARTWTNTANARPLTVAHAQFRRSILDGMRQAANEIGGIKLDVLHVDPDAGGQIDSIIAEAPHAIILCLAGPDETSAATKKANGAGVPVFTVDVPAFEGKVVSHIASDQCSVGRIVVEKMGQLLPSGSKGIVLNEPNATWKRDRIREFKAVVEKAGIEVLEQPCIDSRPTDAGRRDAAADVMRRMLEKYPALNGVLAVNATIASGAAAAVRHAGRSDIVLMGCDASTETLRIVRSGGPLKADVVHFPDIIGRVALKTAFNHLSGRPVPERVPVRVEIVYHKMDAAGSLSKTASGRMLPLMIVAALIVLLLVRRWRTGRVVDQ